MITRKILTLTLLTVTLTLNASIPRELRTITRQENNSISNRVANILFERGIDASKAQELSQAIIKTDEKLFSIMLENFSTHCEIDKETIYQELSKIALSKKSVDFTSYSFLIKLTQLTKQKHLNSGQLKKIEEISTKNQIIYKAFA